MKNNTDIALLIMRLISGIFFTVFGIMKLTGLQGFADTYLGGSFILALLVALGELGGGLALLSGYFYQLGSIILALIMLGAIVLAHPIWNPAEMMNGLIRLIMASLYLGLAMIGTGSYALKKV
ncbi:MAG: DoxX family membrane protein [Nanoarchaeota archaeon]|nr:DoxX family membrane protein [Nanoarchaeota archaeon]